MFLTIFTPTYNRGYIIENAYRSLKRQTFKDFEWLIVDDGSTDNTTAIVQKFIDQSPDMNIRYIKIEHNGKHFAINKSYEEAKGYFYFSLDSDDELYAPETLQLLHDRWEALSASQKNELSGISAYFVDTQGNILGHRFDKPLIIDLELYKQIVFEHKYSLNTPGMIKTNILRKVFFPDIKDPFLYFFPEWIVWMRLYSEHHLKTLLIQDTVYLYKIDRNDSVSTNTHATKALFYQSLYQLNEWLPLFGREYPDFFKPISLTLEKERRRWKIPFRKLWSMLNRRAKIYYMKGLLLYQIFYVAFVGNKLTVRFLGIKLTFSKRR